MPKYSLCGEKERERERERERKRVYEREIVWRNCKSEKEKNMWREKKENIGGAET